MTDVDTGRVRLEKHGAVAHIVLDRPAKINAMTVQMDRQMNELVFEVNNDDDIRSILLYGAGDRGFCAGSDNTDLEEYGNNWQYRNRFDARLDYARAVWLMRKPVVAALHGWCVGGGLEMACSSDIRIATPDARFAAGEIRHGWHGGSGQTQLLTHAIGPGNASQFLLIGEPIDAEASLRMGLVQKIVSREELLADGHAMAQSIAEKAPIAAQMTKHMIKMAQSVPLEVGLLYENDSFAYCMGTQDAAEGRRAFAEKRPAEFKGR
jgi:enoyl-CoA hydratase/carnithine racemase